MAQIRKRGPKQYQARVRLKGHPEASQTFPTRQAAQLWAAQHENLLSQGFAASLQESRSMTLSDALQRYADEVTPHKKSKHQELKRIRLWKLHPLAALPLSEIRGADIARYRDARLTGGASGNTVRLDLALISHLFEVARKDWGLETLANPVKACRAPKLARGRDRRLLPGEEAALLAYCDRRGGQRLKLVIILAIEAAMRRSEIVQGLTWQNVDLHRRLAYLADTKNGDARVVPLSLRASGALQGCVQHSGFVVDLDRDAITRSFVAACRACEIDGLRLHDLRPSWLAPTCQQRDMRNAACLGEPP